MQGFPISYNMYILINIFIVSYPDIAIYITYTNSAYKPQITNKYFLIITPL